MLRSLVNKMRIVPVPNQSDNYAYLIIDEIAKRAASVDPYDVDKVTSTATAEGVEISANISTHHHNDHTGGNSQLQSLYPNIPFYAGSNKASATSHIVKHGDSFKFGNLDIRYALFVYEYLINPLQLLRYTLPHPRFNSILC